MRVLAIDPGLVTLAWARSDGRFGALKPGARRDVDRLLWLRDAVLHLVSAWSHTVVVLERPSFASRGNAVVSLGELHGVLKVALREAGVPVAVVAPGTLKRYASGRGNAPKELVLVEAVKRLGYDGSDHNVADALFLLHMALDYYGLPGAVQMPKAHRAALEAVQWPRGDAVTSAA